MDRLGALHDTYRRTADGRGSFAQTLRGIELLKKHGVSFNTLTTVNRVNQEHPGEVYAFLREWTDWMQFLPVVERVAAAYETEEGQLFAAPPGIHGVKIKHAVTPFSVTPEGYGAFLCAVADAWKAQDAGVKHVQLIDVTLGNILETDLGALMESNRRFGMYKTYGLPDACLTCPDIRLCFGGCPKDRLWGNRNYLCEGYRLFFRHIRSFKFS